MNIVPRDQWRKKCQKYTVTLTRNLNGTGNSIRECQLIQFASRLRNVYILSIRSLDLTGIDHLKIDR